MKIAKLTGLLLFLGWLSCSKTISYSYTYHQKIINATDYTIEIFPFSGPYLLDSFQVEPNSNIVIRNDTDGSFLPFGKGAGIMSDSVSIIFDNAKYLYYIEKYINDSIYVSNHYQRNMLYQRNYDQKEIAEREYECTYTITEEDYKKAIPIE